MSFCQHYGAWESSQGDVASGPEQVLLWWWQQSTKQPIQLHHAIWSGERQQVFTGSSWLWESRGQLMGIASSKGHWGGWSDMHSAPAAPQREISEVTSSPADCDWHTDGDSVFPICSLLYPSSRNCLLCVVTPGVLRVGFSLAWLAVCSPSLVSCLHSHLCPLWAQAVLFVSGLLPGHRSVSWERAGPGVKSVSC